MLLEKETLRRPDLEGIFEGIEPREAFDVFPNEDARFPRQAGREPVKTPVELAQERGEELPKRMTLLDASRAARERRHAELERAKENGDEAAAATSEAPVEEIGFSFGQHAGDYVDPEKGNTFFGESDITEPTGRELSEDRAESDGAQEETVAPEQAGPSHEDTQEIPRVPDAAASQPESQPQPEPQPQPREPERRGRHAKPEEHAWGAPGWGEHEHRNNPYKDGDTNER